MTRLPVTRLQALAATLAAAAAVAPARADLLGLDLEDSPDVVAGFIDVTYDSVGDLFAASGFALAYDDDGSVPAETIDDGVFNLSAVIDGSGLASSGTLTLGGTVLGFGPTLLTASLVDFGFEDSGGQLFEFVFEVTGGDLATDYGGLGSLIGVIMDMNADYSDFTTDFDNLIGGLAGTGAGVADVAPLVPGPAALALLAVAGATSGRRRRLA